MISDYYSEWGWDTATASPTTQTLERLGYRLSDIEVLDVKEQRYRREQALRDPSRAIR